MIKQGEKTEKTKDLRGKIKSDFPKHTLEEALRVATVIENENGGNPLPPEDIAIALGKSPGGSDFKILLSSSIKYGLTSGSYNQPRVSLTELGTEIVRPKSPESQTSALTSAGLSPDTFQKIFDQFKGKKLPEGNFFINTLSRDFGIPKEHADKCASIFKKNMEFLKLIKVATTGNWLSADIGTPVSVAAGTFETETEEETDDESTNGKEGFTKFPKTPPPANVKNAIFIGHGKNRKPLEQLKQTLEKFKIPFSISVEEPNKFRPIPEKVADIMHECGAAILIFTADEELSDTSGNKIWRPSDNVIYELGAASVLYGKKIIIFREEEVSFPTNFRDIGHITFPKDSLNSKADDLLRELIEFGLIKLSVGS